MLPSLLVHAFGSEIQLPNCWICANKGFIENSTKQIIKLLNGVSHNPSIANPPHNSYGFCGVGNIFTTTKKTSHKRLLFLINFPS